MKKAESWRFLITINIITLSHSCSGITGPAQPGQDMLHVQIKQNIAKRDEKFPGTSFKLKLYPSL